MKLRSKRQRKVQASEFKLHVCAQWRLDTAEARIKERSMARRQGRDSGCGNRSQELGSKRCGRTVVCR